VRKGIEGKCGSVTHPSPIWREKAYMKIELGSREGKIKLWKTIDLRSIKSILYN
jgi:hypothetical protein